MSVYSPFANVVVGSPGIQQGQHSQHQMSACNCVGPLHGQPLCPCQMRGVIVRDGRYIKPEQDLGPVRGLGFAGKPYTEQPD